MGRSPINYRLSDPGFTIYHRAALGGLAATIRSWRPPKKKGKGVAPPLEYLEDGKNLGGTLREGERSVTVHFDASSITLSWDEPTTDREALALVLKASFLRTNEGMIYLPGQGFGHDRLDVLIAAHNAYSQTFLQHAKKRPGQGIGSVTILDDDGQGYPLSYKKVDRYSHQTAQGTSLLGDGWEVETGEMPETASLPQSLIPGATGGARDLGVTPEQAFLLHFLMVACPVFSVRSRKWEAKVQSCLVVPNVTNLDDFSRRLELVGTSPVHSCHTNDYLGRIAGGAEEAALRFLLDLKSVDDAERLGVSGARVYAMGKVAWDGNQQNRSWIASVKNPSEYRDMAVFEAANQTLGRAKIIKTKKGEAFAIPASPLPDLIAANLAAGGNWYDGFHDLVAKKKDFTDLSYRKEGLRAMKNAILNRDGEDQLVIRCFQKAWSMKMGSLGERSRGPEKAQFSRLAEVVRERIRNEILRLRTSDQLAGWLTQFMADASRRGSPREFTENAEAFRKFIFNPRNADRLKNLLLFALVSYSAPDAPEPTTEPVDN